MNPTDDQTTGQTPADQTNTAADTTGVVGENTTGQVGDVNAPMQPVTPGMGTPAEPSVTMPEHPATEMPSQPSDAGQASTEEHPENETGTPVA